MPRGREPEPLDSPLNREIAEYARAYWTLDDIAQKVFLSPNRIAARIKKMRDAGVDIPAKSERLSQSIAASWLKHSGRTNRLNGMEGMQQRPETKSLQRVRAAERLAHPIKGPEARENLRRGREKGRKGEFGKTNAVS